MCPVHHPRSEHQGDVYSHRLISKQTCSYLPGFLFGRGMGSRVGRRTNNLRLSWSGRVVNSHWLSRRHTSSGSMSLFLSSSAGMSSHLAFTRSSLMTRRAVGSRLCASHQLIDFFSHSRLPKAIAAALSNPYHRFRRTFLWSWNLTLSHTFP